MKKSLFSRINYLHLRPVNHALALLAALCLMCVCCSHNWKHQQDLLEQQSNKIEHLSVKVAYLEKSLHYLKKKNFTIMLAGDILLDSNIIAPMKSVGINYPFQKVAPLLERYDLVFANLETPVTKIHAPADNKTYTFRLLPFYARSLADIHLDVVSLANNHILDQGAEGLNDTMTYLDEMGILHCGAGKNLDDARAPAVFSFGTADVHILSYCERPPEKFYAGAKKPGTVPLDLALIREDIARYKSNDSIVLVSLHWGVEQTNNCKKYQRRLAHAIIEAGADGIIGHHPHWPQGIELYCKKPIIYSLGNFVNGFYNAVEKDNIFVVLHYTRGDLGTIEVLPVAGKNSDIQFQPYLLTGQHARDHLKHIKRLCRRLNTPMNIRGSRGYITP